MGKKNNKSKGKNKKPGNGSSSTRSNSNNNNNNNRPVQEGNDAVVSVEERQIGETEAVEAAETVDVPGVLVDDAQPDLEESSIEQYIPQTPEQSEHQLVGNSTISAAADSVAEQAVDTESLPEFVQSEIDEAMPWDHPLTSNNHEPLPWEQPTASDNQEPLPWEQPSNGSTYEDRLPLDEPSIQDKAAVLETIGESSQNGPTPIVEQTFASEGGEQEVVNTLESQQQKSESSYNIDSEVIEQVEQPIDDASLSWINDHGEPKTGDMPWDSQPEEPIDKNAQTAEEIAFSTQLQTPSFIDEVEPPESIGVCSEQDENRSTVVHPEAESSLFTDEDSSFLNSLSKEKEVARTPTEQSASNDIDDKLNFLEEDDDLLLDDIMDDDFLDDDEPEPVLSQVSTSASSVVPIQNKYAPPLASRYQPPSMPSAPPGMISSVTNALALQHQQQQQQQQMQQSARSPSLATNQYGIPMKSTIGQGFTQSIDNALMNPQFTSQASVINRELVDKLQKEKTKTDAYDFPSDMLAKHKHVTKTAPTESIYTRMESELSHTHPPQNATQPPLQSRRGSILTAEAQQQAIPGPPAGRTLRPKKSFFEELPVPKQPVAPPRHLKNPYEQLENSSMHGGLPGPSNQSTQLQSPTINTGRTPIMRNSFSRTGSPQVENSVQLNQYAPAQSQTNQYAPQVQQQRPQSNPYTPNVQPHTNLYSPQVSQSQPAQLASSYGPLGSQKILMPPAVIASRKATNPYAPAEVGGHARTLSVNSNSMPVNPNVVPVPQMQLSPMQQMFNSNVQQGNMGGLQIQQPMQQQQLQQLQQLQQQPQQVINPMGLQDGLGISPQPPSMTINRPPAVANKYSPYAPQQQQQQQQYMKPLPVSGQNKALALDTVYGDNLKPDITSPTVSTNRRGHISQPIARVRGSTMSAGNGGIKKQPQYNLPPTHVPAPVIINPENLVRKQWPLFSFSASNKVSSLIPSSDAYGHRKMNVNITDISSILIEDKVTLSFPGPLTKNKTKKKDLERWLTDKLASTGADSDGPYITHEQLLWAILRVMVKEINKPGDFTTSKEYITGVVQVLSPSLNVNAFKNKGTIDYSSLAMSGQHLMNQKHFNARKIEGQGLVTIHTLLEEGNCEGALTYAVSEGDWAMALLIANVIGYECVTEVIKLYADANLDHNDIIQQNLSFCLQSTNQTGFNTEKFIGKEKWLAENYNSVIPFVLLNNSNPSNILIQLGALLNNAGFTELGKISFVLSGVPLIPKDSSQFPQDLSSIIAEEIYEFLLQSSNNVPQNLSNGFPHMLPVKIKHAGNLADRGNFADAKRYTDYTASILKSKQYFIEPATALSQNHLVERLSQIESDSTGWFGGKLARPNLDKVWGQLDKSFNKFVSGEELVDNVKPKSEGLFSKFSPAASRSQSQIDLSMLHPQSQPTLSSYHSQSSITGVYGSSSSHSQSAPTTSSNATLIQGGTPSNPYSGYAPPKVPQSQPQQSRMNPYAPPSLTSSVSFGPGSGSPQLNSAPLSDLNTPNGKRSSYSANTSPSAYKSSTALYGYGQQPQLQQQSPHDQLKQLQSKQKSPYQQSVQPVLPRAVSNTGSLPPPQARYANSAAAVPFGSTQSRSSPKIPSPSHAYQQITAQSVQHSPPHEPLDPVDDASEQASPPVVETASSAPPPAFNPSAAPRKLSKYGPMAGATPRPASTYPDSFAERLDQSSKINENYTPSISSIKTDLKVQQPTAYKPYGQYSQIEVSPTLNSEVMDDEVPSTLQDEDDKAGDQQQHNGHYVPEPDASNHDISPGSEPPATLPNSRKNSPELHLASSTMDMEEVVSQVSDSVQPETQEYDIPDAALSAPRSGVPTARSSPVRSTPPVGLKPSTYDPYSSVLAAASKATNSTPLKNPYATVMSSPKPMTNAPTNPYATVMSSPKPMTNAPTNPYANVIDAAVKSISTVQSPYDPRKVSGVSASLAPIHNAYATDNARKASVAGSNRYAPAGASSNPYRPPPADNTATDDSADEAKQDSVIDDMGIPANAEEYDFYSYGGYQAPPPAPHAGAAITDETSTEEADDYIQEQQEDYKELDDVSNIDDFDEEALPPPSGNVFNPAASLGGANHLRAMFNPPSATIPSSEQSKPTRYNTGSSPINMTNDKRRYVAQDNDDEYYDDVVDDDDDDDVDNQAEKERQRKEKEAKEKEAKEKAKLEAERKKKEEADAKKKAVSDSQKSGWLGGWLGKKKEDGPKPIKAKLGEENAFYYDEEQKRWVNKNATPEEQAASAPPPPPMKRKSLVASGGTPPTPAGPPSRSPEEGGPPSISRTGPPPMGGSGSPIPTKKADNIDDLLTMSSATARKSKRGPRRGYVDVMGQT